MIARTIEASSDPRHGLIDEAPVDLYFVDGKSPQITHTRIARAEIVDRHEHAHCAQCLKNGDRLLRIAHHHAFGQFDFEEARVKVGGIQRIANDRDDIALPELRSG